MPDITFLHVNCIASWDIYVARNKVRPIYQDSSLSANSALNKKICLWNGNITWLKIDAIVNPTNCGFKYATPNSLDACIREAAGPELDLTLQSVGRRRDGDVVITPGYSLPATNVIHVVSPMDRSAESLAKCYRNCLSAMIENDLRTIALPCIATGFSQYPQAEAAHIAIREVWQFLSGNFNKVDRIVFCTYSPEDKLIYESLLQRYFPVDNPI